MAKGDVEYQALADAMRDTTPACAGDWRYLADEHEIDDAEKLAMKALCRQCPLAGLCTTYAAVAKPPAGCWAGRWYKPSQHHTKETNE